MSTCIDLLIVGVGGQGTLLASKIMGSLAMRAGLDVKLSEVHGMAQRGGSVETHVRISSHVASPLVAPGSADYVLSFEPLEAARWCHYLKDGGVLLTSSNRIWPMPVVSGAAAYPEDMDEKLRSRGVRYIALDAQTLALEAGSARCVNIVLLGLLASRLTFSKELWLDAIADCVPQKTLEMNKKAFLLGLEAAKDEKKHVKI